MKMNNSHQRQPSSGTSGKTPLSIFVVSGGMGSSGEQLARTVLAQFPESGVSVRVFPKVFTKEQVQQIMDTAAKNDAVVVHTFVDSELRGIAANYSKKLNLTAIDLVGPLLGAMAARLELEPLGQPGLYRQLFKSYFDRIDAMDYALAQDDGKNPQGWKNAEIVLLGASRVGKTPISLYLSVLGWRVANIPIVAGMSPRESIFEIDRRRLVGLTISPAELIEHRRHRQRMLGVISKNPDYVSPQKVFEELEDIEMFFRRNRIPVVNVSGKPIETSADEVVKVVRRNLAKSEK
jgi:regulator of PEP synthase PpsR (kinase-PPPase family)